MECMKVYVGDIIAIASIEAVKPLFEDEGL